MRLLLKILAPAAVIAFGTLAWLWLQPRTASDCAPADSACLRKVAGHLLSQSLKTTTNPFITDEIEAAGRLLATEGTIDLAAQRDRLTTIGFGPRNVRAVFDGYFDALTDPSYPFDIPAFMTAETGPEGSDANDYRSAAFRLALRDPVRRAEALAHLDQHFERLAHTYIPSGSSDYFILSWLTVHEPTRAADYVLRFADTGLYIANPGGSWQLFFTAAAQHCREGRLDDGRRLLAALTTSFSLKLYSGLALPALLDCRGENAAYAAVDAALVETASRAERILRADPEKQAFIASMLQDLSRDLRKGFAAWHYRQNRGEEVPALWSRYGAAEIARRYLPALDWLPARLKESQAGPVLDAAGLEAEDETVNGRLNRVAALGEPDFSLSFAEGTTARIIELEWPSPQAIAALGGLARHADGSPDVTAFAVGLERQLGCTPSDATMQALLADISAIKDPLDEARAIIELLRFTPALSALPPASNHDCLVK